jgi:acyl carrier protein
VENVVARIWAEILQLERVGLGDDFFDLGGHSLLATQVVSRIREALQVDLSLRALFEKPTIGGLADHLETMRRAGKGQYPAPTAKVDETEEVTL